MITSLLVLFRTFDGLCTQGPDTNTEVVMLSDPQAKFRAPDELVGASELVARINREGRPDEITLVIPYSLSGGDIRLVVETVAALERMGLRPKYWRHEGGFSDSRKTAAGRLRSS